MESVISTIIQSYGVAGLLILVIAGLVYLIWGDRKNNWGAKIDKLDGKMDNMGRKVDLVEEKLGARIDAVEDKVNRSNVIQQEQVKEAKTQSTNQMTAGTGGKLSKVLRSACDKVDCDHIFLGSFHNGTTDLRGLHYCKFDILIDEFKDPLHLRKTDTDFQPLYKDENIMAYGDLPYTLTHMDSFRFNIEEPELLNLSDTLYRRCKSRDIKQIAFAVVRDKEGFPMGFVGCVSYIKRAIKMNALEKCARDIENIYNV